jgi:DNA replication and repair protein RecF
VALMHLKEILIKNFRNYQEEKVTFHRKVNIITGKNAQGKTNLLEAIYIMSLGKSFRTNKDSEMIGFGKSYSKVNSLFEKDDQDLEMEIIYGKEGKSIKIDGVKAKKNIELLENVYIVVFSPDDLKIVKDEPEKRRRFIDRELCQIKPTYYRNLARYKKILTQRNALLKQENFKENHLLVWNEELAEYGSRIMLERREFVEKLSKISSTISNSITNQKEEMIVTYDSNIESKDNLKDQKQVFFHRLEETRDNDLFRRSTTVGPHKDDLKIWLQDLDIRNFGSQGQQRTAALSLKLAEIQLIKDETSINPILLLDDVLSELDEERQRFLIHSLKDVQLFITTTEISEALMNSLPASIFFKHCAFTFFSAIIKGLV